MFPYLPLYYRFLGFSLGEVGFVLGVWAFVGLLASPLWGALSDRYRGSPWVLVLATATALGGTVVLGSAAAGMVLPAGLVQLGPPDPLLVVVAAALVGAGMSGITPILDARALETAGANREGYGPIRAWGSFSYILSALGTGVLVEQLGPRALFAVIAVSLVATGLIGLTLRPAAVERAGRQLATTTRPLRELGRLFGPQGLGLFLLGAFLAWYGMSAVLSFIPLRFEELGAGASIVGLGGAIAAAVEVPVMLRFPGLTARFGAERLLVAGAGLIAVRSIIATVAPEAWVLLVAAIFAGLGYALFFVGGVTYVSRRVPHELAATAQGVFQGVGTSLSQVVASATGGVIAGAIGLSGLFGVGAGIGLVATLVIALAVRSATKRRYAPPATPTEAT
ncbi:MAG TPA: MFS transporter [Candidatus Limnocylindria bacterium]|nr:MFS transporter [Candidatus Limnocylindria bacterium]